MELKNYPELTGTVHPLSEIPSLKVNNQCKICLLLKWKILKIP